MLLIIRASNNIYLHIFAYLNICKSLIYINYRRILHWLSKFETFALAFEVYRVRPHENKIYVRYIQYFGTQIYFNAIGIYVKYMSDIY